MPSFNKAVSMGHLTRNPDLKYLENGTPVVNFGLAMNHKFKQGEDLKEEVCFIDVVVFGKQAEPCAEYLTKGAGCLVEGRLRQRQWVTEDGQKHSKHEIVAQSVTFMGKSDRSQHEGKPPEHEGGNLGDQ